MAMRLFLLYTVIEMAVIIALTATIGLGWTVLALIGAFVFGAALAGSQLRRQLTQLRRGLRDPRAQVTDSALVGLGTVLVLMPGLLTSVAGLLMLAPPTRTMMRPVAAALAARGISRRVTFIRTTPDYIDGEVIDVQDGFPANLPAVTRRPV